MPELGGPVHKKREGARVGGRRVGSDRQAKNVRHLYKRNGVGLGGNRCLITNNRKWIIILG